MSFRKNKRVPKFDYYAKVHDKYSDHLIDLLKEPFYQRVKEICESVKAKNNAKTLKSFQAEMKNVKKWDYDDLKKSAKFVVHKSGSSYVPKLLKAVIISGTKLLTATSSRKKVDAIEMNVPETITFFSKCFINIGRSFYMEPYLICDAGQQPGQRLTNITDSIDLIEKSIKKTIDSFLPYDDILEVYLANAEDDDTSDEEPEVEPEQEESDNDSESDIESDDESDNESQHGGASDDEMPQEASDDDDVMSVHSEKSEHTDEIKENDFSQDETLDIAEVAPQSINTIDIIGDDIDDAFNFVPTMSDTEADSSMPTPQPQPQPQQVKVVAVNQPVPQAQVPQQSTQTSSSDVKQIIFAPGAMDLTDM